MKVRAKREKSTSTTGHYVRNADLLPAVIEAKALNRVTDKLIRMIQQIAERYSRKSNFIGYSFREDMVSSAVMNLCNNALKFNPEKSQNPFSFYTTAIHNSFLQYIMDEKKHRNIRDALLISAGSNPSFNFMEAEKDERDFEIKESDEVPDTITNGLDADPTGELVEVPAEQVILPGDTAPRTPKEDKIRYAGRAPSAVKKYGPDDFEIDANGNLVMKVKPPVVEEPKKVRKTRAKKGE